MNLPAGSTVSVTVSHSIFGKACNAASYGGIYETIPAACDGRYEPKWNSDYQRVWALCI
eukprot:TRINITY_DN7500_c0_g1_i1.p1 TRINITY_DN7500_c0_g1~~TRINITY_DN7500_c0_g1_i1.p1  ORF type:complete len:59 (-),score=1.86 TRINITY_DN7500_c0_g1_i1:129-305(-)